MVMVAIKVKLVFLVIDIGLGKEQLHVPFAKLKYALYLHWKYILWIINNFMLPILCTCPSCQ